MYRRFQNRRTVRAEFAFHKIKLMGDMPKIEENTFLRVNAVLEYPRNQNKFRIQEHNWGGEIKFKEY